MNRRVDQSVSAEFACANDFFYSHDSRSIVRKPPTASARYARKVLNGDRAEITPFSSDLRAFSMRVVDPYHLDQRKLCPILKQSDDWNN